MLKFTVILMLADYTRSDAAEPADEVCVTYVEAADRDGACVAALDRLEDAAVLRVFSGWVVPV